MGNALTKLSGSLKCKCVSQTSSYSILPHQAHANKWILSSCSAISSGKESLRQEPTIRACLKTSDFHIIQIKNMKMNT